MSDRSQLGVSVLLVLGASIPLACTSQPTEPPAPVAAKPAAPAGSSTTAAVGPAEARAVGAQEIDAAIAAGIGWLARHQDADGSWSPTTAASHCDSSAPLYRPKKAYNAHYDAGVTGLAVLAVLGEVESKKPVVDPTTGAPVDLDAVARKGVAKLVAIQRDNGAFSKDRSFMYVEALGAQALCEALRVLGDRDLAAPAQKAVDFVQAAQRPSPSGDGSWGWRYSSRQEIEKFQSGAGGNSDDLRELFDSDTSVTGRCVAALHAAKAAGLSVDEAHLGGARQFVRWASQKDARGEPTGLVGYLDARGAGAKVTGPNDHFVYHPAVMSAIAMQVLDEPGDAAFEAKAAEQVRRDEPSVSEDKLSVDYYYWHNGTKALADADAAKFGDARQAWNTAVASALTSLQDRAEKSCSNGGWLVADRWASDHGGPIYTTALNVLTLQACR